MRSGLPDLPAGFADVSSLVQQDFNFAQLVDNLLRCVRFPDHLLPPFLFSSLTLKLDSFLGGRPNEEAWNRLQELKWTEWRPFIEAEVSRLGSSLKTLVAELQGTWHFACDQCQSRVTVEIGPREISALLKGVRVAECPRCRDFHLPPAPPVAPHKIDGSALEDLVEAYLAGKGPPGKNEMERT